MIFLKIMPNIIFEFRRVNNREIIYKLIKITIILNVLFKKCSTLLCKVELYP
jgi:hypothetical protein